jgi:hypothetical protein
MQIPFFPALQRSRPSAFAVAGVARPQSCIGHGHAGQGKARQGKARQGKAGHRWGPFAWLLGRVGHHRFVQGQLGRLPATLRLCVAFVRCASSRQPGRLGRFLPCVVRGAAKLRHSAARRNFCFVSALRFSYSRTMPAIDRVPPNPSLKGRSNGVPPSLGHRRRSPIFCGPGLASHRRPPP